MTGDPHPLEYRPPAEDGRACRSVRRWVIGGTAVGAMLTFAAGMIGFVGIVICHDGSPGRVLLRWMGVAFGVETAVAVGLLGVLWPRHVRRPFAAGLVAGMAASAGLLAVWAFTS